MTIRQSSTQALSQIFADAWVTQGIWVAAELGIADLLVNSPLTAEALAEQTHTHSGTVSLG
jgi:hypothetical protein